MSVVTTSPVSQTVLNMAESATLKMSQLGRELRAKGDIQNIRLSQDF